MPEKYRVERWRAALPPNAAMLRHCLVAEGYDVIQWCDMPGTFYGPHKHATEQSHWLFSGRIEITVMNAGTHVLEAGDRDFLPADTYHAAEVLGDEPAVYLVGEKRR